jgi:6-phosphogluconolactonase
MTARARTYEDSTGDSIVVLPDPESLALAAAAAVAAAARGAAKLRGRFTFALAGGSTPRPVYELLAKPPFADLMPWETTHVFWGDERCVDAADPRSNERMARLALLDHVPVPEGHVHPIRCPASAGAAFVEGASGEGASDEGVARMAADQYEGLLRGLFAANDTFALDLVLLGLGDNGHTASLFPGSDVLRERDRWVAASLEDPATAAVTSGTGQRLWRVTMTAPFIDRARLVLFVVGGISKAAAVQKVIEGDADPEDLPAVMIRPRAGRLCWLLDEEAASQLSVARRVSATPQVLSVVASEPTGIAGREGGG